MAWTDHDLELAWAAGFFDGEGHISASIDQRHRKAPHINISVAQSNNTHDSPPASLTRFQSAVGVGVVQPRKSGRGRLGKRPMWYWKAYQLDEIRTVIDLLLPHAIEKRDQMAEAMAIRLEWEGLWDERMRFCKRGHEFTPENTYTYENRLTPARLCRACNRENTRKSKARRRAQAQLIAAEGLGG